MMKVKNNEWTQVETAISTLSKEYDGAALTFLLNIGYNQDLTQNEDLTELDIYDALQAVFLAVIEQAFQDQKYELISLVNKAHNKQSDVMKKEIENMFLTEDERQEDYWHLFYTNEYFQITQQNLANKYAE